MDGACTGDRFTQVREDASHLDDVVWRGMEWTVQKNAELRAEQWSRAVATGQVDEVPTSSVGSSLLSDHLHVLDGGGACVASWSGGARTEH